MSKTVQVTKPDNSGVRIIRKERRLASPPDGMRQAWVEWQVVRGKTIVTRHDTEAQAIKAKNKMSI